MIAHLPPSMALPAASEASLATTKGLLDCYVSLLIPWGLMRPHKALKAVQAMQSCKTLPASSEDQFVKFDRFEDSTDLQKKKFDRQNI